ncbi:uncharacterized protein LOC135496752 [Lineus longissimus]|uniref:uncharacterized protein LOC135496752 n=1 Tax=Lineus longissimus TaxID=88925 RepID=UPI002B4C773A
MPKWDGNWADVETKHPAPKRYVRCHRCKNASLVALWDGPDGNSSCFGRANLDKNIEGLQGYFPWGGDEKDSVNFGKFKVLVKDEETGYHWVRICVLEKNPGKYHPLDIDGKSPCCINNLLGKVKIAERKGFTSWGGKEVQHTGDELTEAWVLCVRKRNQKKRVVKKQARRDAGRNSDSSSSSSSSSDSD